MAMGNLLIGMMDLVRLIVRKLRSRKPRALDSGAPARETWGMTRAYPKHIKPTANGWWWRAHSFGAARWRGW
jgi:hypothetical protein